MLKSKRISKNNNEETDNFDIIYFPESENEIFQCLFQELIGLIDLRLLIKFEKSNYQNKYIINSNLLLKNK